MTYSEKLRDPRWQRKRLEIFQRDNWRCVLCGDSSKTLNVHHTVYKGQPWSIGGEYLHTLCADCHEVIQSVWNLARACRPAAVFSPFELKDIATRAYDLMDSSDVPWKQNLIMWAEICTAADRGTTTPRKQVA